MGCRRWTNRGDLAGYLGAAGRGERPDRDVDLLTPVMDAVERMVFGLRMSAGVEPARIAAVTGCSEVMLAKWIEVLGRLAHDGLVRGTGGVWRLTHRGREMADYVAVELMP